MKTKQIAIIAVCTSLMAVLSPMSIPLAGGVPISLATFVVMLIGMLLSPIEACTTVALYIVLAMIGVPVLSGYRAGAGVLFGMTGGYIFGYIPLAVIVSIFKKFGTSNISKSIFAIGGMVLGTVVLYAIGTCWFMNFTGSGLSASLSACVLPFIPGDLVKMAAVLLIAPRVSKYIAK